MESAHLPFMIEKLTKENFDESIEMMEALLTNECVGDECDIAMGLLKEKCKEIGMELPPDYAPTHH